MSAVEEYEYVKQDRLGSEGPILADVIAMYADKAIEELEAALHSAYQDWLDDFPDDCPMDYDRWLACHITCGKEMRAP